MATSPLHLPAADRAAAALREQITEGELFPGEALRECKVATSLAVSRNTVREAFRLLAHDGLVEHTPNRGVTVRSLSHGDVVDIYRIRRALERLGLEESVVDPSALLATVADGEEAAHRGDWAAVATADLRFHQAVVGALGSVRLDALCQRLLAELRLAFAAMPDANEFHTPYLRRNRRLADLVVGGDIATAQTELAGYLDDAEKEILRVIDARDVGRARR